MEQSDLLNAQVLLKKCCGLLHEILDLSGQLAEAANRQDPVSVQLLLSMRQEPLNLLADTDQLLRAMLERLPPADGAGLRQLLDGENPSPPIAPSLAAQGADYRQLLKKTVELDRQISLKLAGESSIYRNETPV